MRRHIHRRRVERLRLYPALHGSVGNVEVTIDEISLHGARTRSAIPLHFHEPQKLAFEWEDERNELMVEVVRCTLDPLTRNYQAGVKFTEPRDPSNAAVYRLIDAHIEDALAQQIANATGRPLSTTEKNAITRLKTSAQDRAMLRMNEYRGRGFTRYSLVQNQWDRSHTREPEQPQEGFTIWSFEEDEHVKELCRIYASSDPSIRSLVKICAELSLYVEEEALPPQYFQP